MPRQWRGIPLTTDPRVLAKAPTYNEYLEQLHDTEHRGGFYLPMRPFKEYPTAAAIMDSVPDLQAMALGEKYEFWRFASGLSVKAPSGWTFMMHVKPEKGVKAGAGDKPSGKAQEKS